jgi:hypothetical protein
MLRSSRFSRPYIATVLQLVDYALHALSERTQWFILVSRTTAYPPIPHISNRTQAMSISVARRGGILLDPVRHAYGAIRVRLESMTPWRRCLVALYCLFVLVGEVSTIIAMNFWLTKFTTTGGAGAPFATQMSSSLLYWLIFVLANGAWWLAVSPRHTSRFVRSKRGLVLLVFMGLLPRTPPKGPQRCCKPSFPARCSAGCC